jgi:hypothetical protein
MEPEGSLPHSQRARNLSEHIFILFVSFSHSMVFSVNVSEISFAISYREVMIVWVYYAVFSIIISSSSVVTIKNYKIRFIPEERLWTLAMSRLKEPQEKLAVTWNVPSTFLSSMKNDTQRLCLDFMSSVATDTFVYCTHSMRLPIA